MTLFGYTLRFLRSRERMSLSALAERLGLHEAVLRNIEDGYIEPEEAVAETIASFFHVTIGYMKGSVEVYVPEENKASAPTRFVRLQPRPLDPKLCEENMLRAAETREVILPVPSVDRSEYMAVVATDNTMHRYCVMAGDILVVQNSAGGLRNGDLALLTTKLGQVILRRYFREGDEIVLRSDADDLLPPIRIGEKDRTCRIVGKVVEIIRKVDAAFLDLRAQNPPQMPEEILPPPQFPLEKEEEEAAYTYQFGK